MPHAVAVDLARLQEMPDQRVGLVGGLAAVPPQCLAGVVLVVADLAAVRHFEQRVGKVPEDA
jgi:hypothetical protein